MVVKNLVDKTENALKQVVKSLVGIIYQQRGPTMAEKSAFDYVNER
nr:MAG TPA: hypothetical protein [Caudoviricetes sp.]